MSEQWHVRCWTVYKNQKCYYSTCELKKKIPVKASWKSAYEEYNFEVGWTILKNGKSN